MLEHLCWISNVFAEAIVNFPDTIDLETDSSPAAGNGEYSEVPIIVSVESVVFLSLAL